MGLFEGIDHKLNLICAHLGLAPDQVVTTASLPKFDAVPGIVAEAATPTVQGTTAGAATVNVTTTALPVARITVKEALAAGKALTGNEIDEQGCYYDASIGTKVPAVTKKNIWKRGQNIEETVYEAKIAEIKAAVAAEKAAAPTTTTAVNPHLSAANATANMTGTLPAPGAGLPSPGALPGVPAVNTQPADNPLRAELIQLVNVLVDKYKVDYDVVSQLFTDNGSPDGTFPTLPEASFPIVKKLLNSWAQTIDLFDQAHADIGGMNGGDQTYLTTIMTQLNIGTTDLGYVSHDDIYKLYRSVANYRIVLQNHFKLPITPVAANPME